MYRVLTTLGYRHMTSAGEDRLHSSLASQLESCGLWQWAVFVLLHLPSATRRHAAVTALPGRHVRLAGYDCVDYPARERFLLEKLGVPEQWVAAAKAVLAGARGRPRDQALHLIEVEF